MVVGEVVVEVTVVVVEAAVVVVVTVAVVVVVVDDGRVVVTVVVVVVVGEADGVHGFAKDPLTNVPKRGDDGLPYCESFPKSFVVCPATSFPIIARQVFPLPACE